MKKVAAIQMTSGMDLQANLLMAEALLEKAAAAGACLAVLPEMFPLLGAGDSFTKAKQAIQEVPGEGQIQAFLSNAAKRHKMWIVGGTIPLASADPQKNYAAALIFNDKGEAVARYDKLHLFDAHLTESEIYKESDSTMPGNKIVVIDTPLGRAGIAICYDLRFPELFREMFYQGAEIFLVPVAFTLKTGKMHWDILIKAIAVQNFAYVITAGQCGVHGMGRETYGNSSIISPSGEVIERIGSEVGVIIAEIDLNKVEKNRKNIPVGQHQRIFMDCGKLKA